MLDLQLSSIVKSPAHQRGFFMPTFFLRELMIIHNFSLVSDEVQMAYVFKRGIYGA